MDIPKKIIQKSSKHGIGYDLYKQYFMGESSFVFKIWRSIMRIFGKLMIIIFFLYIIISLYSYLFDVCKLYFFVYKHNSLMLIIFGLILSFNILFNYILCVHTSPGNTEIFKEYTEEDYQNLKKQIGILNFCKKCETFKPERSHHCTICNKCIFKKDHHNAWINNCVGHFNLRYFLLLNLYFWLYLLLNGILFFNMIYEPEFKNYKHERSSLFPFVILINIILFFLFSLMNVWQWYLAFKGETTIESLNKVLDEYSKKNDNSKNCFFIIFGTNSICNILLPSISKLPYDGINWDPQDFSTKYLTKDNDNNDNDQSLGVLA